MDAPITSFWGKLERDEKGAVRDWHPLVDHCLDVSMVFRALVELPGIRRALEAAAGQPLSSAQLDRLGVFALLHDIGKCNHGFQAKSNVQTREVAGHVREVAPLLLCEQLGADAAEALAFDTLCTWFMDSDQASCPTAARFLIAAVSHHGEPQKIDSWEAWGQSATGWPSAKLWRPQAGRDPIAGVHALVSLARDTFPEAFATQVPPLPERVALEHRFSGLVMLADWLGSDTRFFPFRKTADEDRLAFARTQARHALAVSGLDCEPARIALVTHVPGFVGLFGREPYPLQSRLAQEQAIDADSRLLIAESDTGSGKTEAALAWFLRLYAAGKVDGLYFALPTRVAARELCGRVEGMLKRLMELSGAAPAPCLLAVPGYARATDATDGLPDPTGILWSEEDDAERREHFWAAEHPKRFLAAPVAVGTVDQALLSAIKTRHAHLRSVCLDRHLLVVDEVHASDPYMHQLLRSLLDGHRARGGWALLLSATLGEAARALFTGQPTRPLAAAVELFYPALTDGRGIPQRVPSPVGRGKAVEVQFRDALDDIETVLGWIAEALAASARVLVVCNIVQRAIDLQRAVEADARIPRTALFALDGVICPHHGRFAAADRERLDAAVSARFGKDSAPGPALLIGTQTLEQSLDLDADLLITDHAPMDVLLQRIGRLHRHPRKRPEAYAAARCFVLSAPSTEFADWIQVRSKSAPGEARGPAGFGTVYADLRTLVQTRVVLEAQPHIELPRDNRHLVESALHPEALALWNEGVWARHAAYLEGTLISQLVQGSYAVFAEQPFGEFDFPREERVATRLGLGARVIALPAPVVGPFGIRLTALPLPEHFARGLTADMPEAVECAEGVIRFQVEGRAFRYSRFGLEREPA